MSHDDGMNMSMPMPMPSPPMSPSYNNQSNYQPMDGMMTMQMTFFWGNDVVLLFDGWPGNGRLGMYLLALAAVLLVAVAAEILSVAPVTKPSLSPAAGAVVHGTIYALRMALLYLVMLAVMSFNVGVFVAAVAGHSVGRLVVKYRELAAVARAVDFRS